MCCEDDLVPPAVADMLAGYRALLAERGFDWGEEWKGAAKLLLRYVNWCDADRCAAWFRELKATGAVVSALDVLIQSFSGGLPPGIAIVRPTGVEVREPLPFAVPNHPVTYQILVADSSVPTVVESVVTAERPDLHVAGHRVRAVEPAAAGRLRLISDAESRWSVQDERAGAWFPDGALHKYDWENRPYFHGNDLLMDVPVGRVTVTVARGCEHSPVTADVEVRAVDETTVEMSPRRLYDAAARGWYGGDMHVHLNYSGDLVCTPRDAARMQRGEGLHVMNLVAANAFTALIYDREAFEQFAGRDLPWSTTEIVARWGVEYRNDLFGHFHALGPTAPPARYQTGHPRSGEPQDWPPNSVAAAELRGLGATIGYTHPVQTPLDGSCPAEVFADDRARISEARELVADAALGLVDSVDLGQPSHISGVEHLYHRLLGCGLRLAATAGTDAMLSHSRLWAHSNPPGWYRAYARLGDAPLSVPAWQDAVRAGKTFVTNGPWLEFDVAGHGPGATLDCSGRRAVRVVARVTGLGVEQIQVVGPDGPVAAAGVAPEAEDAALAAYIQVTEPTWLAATVRGKQHRTIRGPQPAVYAHTSPVWVNLAGRSVARAVDAAWCLDWLDRFETLARERGVFTAPGQFDELLDVLDRARVFYREIVSGPASASSNVSVTTTASDGREAM